MPYKAIIKPPSVSHLVGQKYANKNNKLKPHKLHSKSSNEELNYNNN